ncbi:MAG: sialidase family protein, partial [Planctomycetota bacterium]
DGRLMQNMRSYHETGERAVAVSEDGGETFGPLRLDKALKTPVCQGSVLRLSWPEDASLGGRSRIVFSSPRGKKRARLSVWVSYDEGQTWPIAKLVHAGGAAYSNLIALPDAKVGVLYEKDGYKSITLATFDLAWLEGSVQ